jgi:UDP-galactopyranose mutase/very-short-patch-repair endonuclease
MIPSYDYLIVGSGLFGATFARLASDRGKKCLVIDKRPQLGGNVYCENLEGINVHTYGAHIFHTNNKRVWDFVNSFVEFNRYTNSPVANYQGRLYNLPFNMNTFYQMWGVTTPAEALAKIDEQKAEAQAKMKADGVIEPRNLEEQALLLIGKDIYERLIKGYTEKQWGRKCTDLPAFIIKRLPVRFVFDNNYFNNKYQGIPIGGYNKLIDGLLDGIDTITGLDFFAPLNPPCRGTSDYRCQADGANYALLKENAKRMRKEPTEAEAIFWKMVQGDALGYSFRRQHVIGDYIVDFVCLKKQIVVEIDGGYHHDETQRDADKKRTEYLNTKGFQVLRFTNEEIIANTPKVLETLMRKLAQPTIYELLEDTSCTFPLQGGLRGAWPSLARQLVYTGPIDQFFDYKYGKLEYRTVRFENEILDTPNYQGNAVVNYTEAAVPYTRIIEHKHFEMFGPDVDKNPKTVISREYSTEWLPGMEPYYPVNDERNMALYQQYKSLIEQVDGNIIFGGRLAEYRYYDMAPVIERAMSIFDKAKQG